MLIATFNCNSVRSRLGHILEWLADHAPDVLALQETKVTDGQFPADAFRQAGWQVVFRGQKSYNGVALVSRKALEDVSFGLADGDQGESETRLAAGRLGKTWIVNTYVPQGRELGHEQFAFKLAWFGRLRDWFAARFDPARDSLAWVGDLNVAPAPADVYDSQRVWPHVCHCQEVIEAFRDVTGFGFVDVFRKHLPGPGAFTFWDYRTRDAVDRGLGWRIDHVQATAPLAAKSAGCSVDVGLRRLAKPSDHTVVAARFFQ